MATGTSSKQQQREGSPAAEALRDEAEGPLQRPLPQVPPSGGSSEAQAARESPRFSRKELQDLGAKDVSDGPENQALHTPWTFWFDRSPRGSRAQDFFANLRSLCTVRTIKAFWCAFNNLRGVDDLEERESYHLMRDTRRPVWEDSDKVDGGMWTFKCRKSESATLWVELLVAAVGEQFSASVAEGDEVIGISVRIRGYDKNTFQIWNQSADMASKATVMQRAKELMPGAELIDTFYQSNTERLKESLLRPTTFYPTRGPPSHPFYPPSSSSLRPHHAPHHHHHHQSHFRPPQQFPPPVLLNPAGGLGVFNISMAPTATGTAVAATGVHGGLGGPITPATMTLTRPHTQEEQSPLQATQVSGVPLTPATKPAPRTHTQQKQEQEKQEEKQIPLQTQVGGGSVLTEKAAEAELTTSRDQGGGGIRREGGAVEDRSPDPHHHHSSHHPHPHHHHHPHRSAHHHHHHRGQPTPSPPNPHHPYPHPPPPHAHQHHHHHSPPPPPQQHHTTK